MAMWFVTSQILKDGDGGDYFVMPFMHKQLSSVNPRKVSSTHWILCVDFRMSSSRNLFLSPCQMFPAELNLCSANSRETISGNILLLHCVVHSVSRRCLSFQRSGQTHKKINWNNWVVLLTLRPEEALIIFKFRRRTQANTCTYNDVTSEPDKTAGDFHLYKSCAQCCWPTWM